MDDVTAHIADFATGLAFEDLPSEVVRAATTRYADSVACALGALSAEPSRAGTRLARETATPGANGAPMIGHPVSQRAPADLAAFVNTTMIRYLDLNDWTPNGHPSDCLGGLVAAAGPGTSGRDLILGAVVAYEVMIGITSTARLAAKGWDQGFAVGVGTVAGLGAMLRLDRDTVANAVGIITAAGVPVAATRSGDLSMWKACATAYATRNAVFAIQVAREGITGPLSAFDGRRGIKQVVSGPFELRLGQNGYRITGTSLKFWPVCYHAQASAWAAAELRGRIPFGDLDTVHVDTYEEAWRSTGSEPEKWRPRSRETADHSTPWVVARVLLDGQLNASSFEPEKVTDPAALALMDRITMNADPDITSRFPRHVISRITATDRKGQKHVIEVVDPSGHPNSQMPADEIKLKFSQLAAGAGMEAEAAAHAAGLWNRLDQLPDVSEALAATVPASGRS